MPNEKRTYADLTDLEKRVVNYRIDNLRSTGTLRDMATVEDQREHFAQMKKEDMDEMVAMYKDKLPTVEGVAVGGSGGRTH